MIRATQLALLLKDRDRVSNGKRDPLVITPAPSITEENDGTASVDLRLGTWFMTLRQPRMPYLKINDQRSSIQFTKMRYVPFGDNYYLHPRSFVLAVTLEWLRLPNDLGAFVIGKSSWGRRGLIIATATGVHPGFNGCLTLELSNIGEIPIQITPGLAICQLFLHTVEGPFPGRISHSQFDGSRKPALGKVRLDDFARKLAGRSPISNP